jgi:hypothetical protein
MDPEQDAGGLLKGKDANPSSREGQSENYAVAVLLMFAVRVIAD